MDCASLPDLDSLDVEALKALAIQHRLEIAAQRAELAARDAEIEQQRQTLSDEIEELRRSSSEQIEHLKLVIEKLRRRVFGVKSEKIVIQLEQLELRLEELESSQAEMEAAAERGNAGCGTEDQIPTQAASRTPSTRSRHSRFFRATAVPTAAASCVSLAKMSPSSWSTYPIASRLFVMYGRSSPAAAAMSAWLKRLAPS